MPRGKRTVFGITCSECGQRITTLRYHKQDKQGKSWKEHTKEMQKYCSKCRKRQPVKGKEERHSK